MKNILTLLTMIMLALFFVACGDKEKDDTCPMECPEGQVSVNIESTDAEEACKCQDVHKEDPTCDPVCTEGQTCACTTGEEVKCECKANEETKPSNETDADKDKVSLCNPVCTETQECICADNEAGDTLCICNEKKSEETDPVTPEADKTQKSDCKNDADCEANQICSCLDDECLCAEKEESDKPE